MTIAPRALVGTRRFTRATCKEANRIHVGQTKRSGKVDRFDEHALPVKNIYLHPR